MYFLFDNGLKSGIIQIVIIHKKIIFYASWDGQNTETRNWQGDYAGDDNCYPNTPTEISDAGELCQAEGPKDMESGLRVLEGAEACGGMKMEDTVKSKSGKTIRLTDGTHNSANPEKSRKNRFRQFSSSKEYRESPLWDNMGPEAKTSV
jgi:hypothetical protein